MYIAVVLAQTVVLPLVSAVIQLAVAGGKPVLVFGVWFLFWGVGTRLLVAGLSQIVNPRRTTAGIFGTADAAATQLAQELGFANLSMGVVAVVGAVVPGWGIPGAIAGGLFLGIAGLRHLPQKYPSSNEKVATWTDLLVFLAMIVYVVALVTTGEPSTL